MTIVKFLTPHFVTGKILITGKAILDIILLLIRDPSRQSWRLARLILQVKPTYTMVKNHNLINLYDLVRKANSLNLAGDLVECGVWNGGSAAIMGVALAEDNKFAKRRKLWLFDSFQGLPAPGARDGQIAKESHFRGWLKGDVQKVQKILKKMDVPMKDVCIMPGWFNETLKTAPIEAIAVLHVDADWYDSVKLALEIFYDRVVSGGFVVFDDYGFWTGCDRAVGDFFSERGIQGITIRQTARVGAYLQKP